MCSGKAGVPTDDRVKLIRFIRDITSAYEDVLTLHAEGSMAAQEGSQRKKPKTTLMARNLV
jgi:aromatic ring hydroxylase